MTSNTDTITLNYWPANSEGVELNCAESRIYTLTELGAPVWAKGKTHKRGIFARVAERDNAWRQFLFSRMEGETRGMLEAIAREL